MPLNFNYMDGPPFHGSTANVSYVHDPLSLIPTVPYPRLRTAILIQVLLVAIRIIQVLAEASQRKDHDLRTRSHCPPHWVPSHPACRCQYQALRLWEQELYGALRIAQVAG